MNHLLGREKEVKLLERLWASKVPEFIAVYGRRRVGKTHLIREVFSSKDIYFEVTGLKDGSMQQQLEIFAKTYSHIFFADAPIQVPGSWKQAFSWLTEQCKKVPKNKKITIVFDELPWMATKRSGLLQQLDHYWNTEWSRMSNMKVIACGSAASWILDNLINAKGGLYNRLTQSLLLKPFSLNQTKAFLNYKDIKLSNKQVLDIYMVMGGIPHYLNQIVQGESALQAINRLCFREDGLLFQEFSRIFKALFDSSDVHLSLIRTISKYRYGISRNELINKLKIASGGTLNTRLNELEAAGFIKIFIPYGKEKKEHYYRVIDEYSNFYLYWIEKARRQIIVTNDYFKSKANTPAWEAWAGYTFETICYKHVDEIKKKLGLVNIGCEVDNWRYVPKRNTDEDGAQIDLLFDRDDGFITLCEIKYSKNKYILDKSGAKKIMQKMDVFQKQTKTKKDLSVALITTEGLTKNVWSDELVDNVVTLDDIIL